MLRALAKPRTARRNPQPTAATLTALKILVFNICKAGGGFSELCEWAAGALAQLTPP